MKTVFFFLAMIITPFLATSQYEWYTALKVEELMLDPHNNAIQAAYTELNGETFFNKEAPQLLSNPALSDFTELSPDDYALLSQLYNLYYKEDTVLTTLSGQINYHDVKRLILKLNKNAEMQSNVNLNGPLISQAQILTAITDVIIERAKQELAKAFFDKWAKKLRDGVSVWYDPVHDVWSFKDQHTTPHTIHLDRILVHTLQCIENSKDYMTPEMGQTFKDALTKDLENLLPNFIQYGLPDQFKNNRFVDDYVLASYNLIQQLVGNAQFSIAADEFLNALITAHGSASTESTIYKLIKVLHGSFLTPDGEYSINPTAFRNATPETFRLYLYMLSSNPNLPPSIRTVLGSTNQDSLKQFVSSISRLQFTLESIFKTKDSHEKIESLLPASQSFLDAAVAGINFYYRMTGTTNTSHVSQFLDQAIIGVEFVTNLKNENYSKSALNVVDFISSTFNDSISHDLVKYFSLIADISHAQDGSEIRAIVDRAILPVGSYAIKRSTAFGISINSYCGLAGGLEWNVYPDKNSKSYGALGLSLPIGIGFNWSKGDEDAQKGSHTFFASIIDLGAIANYSLKSKDGSGSESVSSAPEITFDNVFAPGMTYIEGFANIPISLSLGLQYLPSLREITAPGQINLGEVNALQLKLGVLVDIPLFNIMIGGKKK